MMIYCCNDLLYATRITAIAEKVGICCQAAYDLSSLKQSFSDDASDSTTSTPQWLVVDIDTQPAHTQFIQQAKTCAPDITVIAFSASFEKAPPKPQNQPSIDHTYCRKQFPQALAQLLKQQVAPHHHRKSV